jgi:predicted NAD/FAD-dependent oxidoreductase
MPHLGTTTIYFVADRPPFSEPLLFLNGGNAGVVNNLAVITNVQPGYTPDGTSLMAASVIGAHAMRGDEDLLGLVRQELHTWFGAQTTNWECLQIFRIENALPARPRLSSGFCEYQGVLYAGDYLSYGSQNGALLAGRAVAQHILSEGGGS